MRRHVGRLALAFGMVALGSVVAPSQAHADEWRTDDPVPPGYHIDQPKTGGTVAAVGLGFFLGGYVPVAALGGLGALICDSAGPCTPSPAKLLVPMAGPFLFGATHPLLVLSGVAQTGGVAVAIMGLVMMSNEKPSIVPDEVQLGSVRVRVQPSVGSGTAGAMIGGTF